MSAVPARAAEPRPPANEAEMRDALAWVTDTPSAAQEPEKSVWAWMWEALQGDFNMERSTGQIAFDAGISMIPVVDQICDVRDIIANCRSIAASEEKEQTRRMWVSLALTLIGLFPTLGSLVKGVLKIFFLFVRRHGLNHVSIAIELAMSWVITLLRKREVQKYLRLQKVDEVFAWLAKQVRALRARVNTAEVLAAFDRGIALMKNLSEKVCWLPGLHQSAQAAIERVLRVRRDADAPIGEVLKPVLDALDTIARRLEVEQAFHRAAVRNTMTVHFWGTLPEARAITLMREAKPLPAWLSRGTNLKFPGMKWNGPTANQAIKKAETEAIEEARATAQKLGRLESDIEVEHWPILDKTNVGSFHTMQHAVITGPAKLYRIGSPSSRAMGDCWFSEEVYQEIIKSADPKAAWRKNLAVWPDWNANGQLFVYELKQGESLKVWRGPASSQVKPEKLGLDAHLEGGWEQVVFKPDTAKGIQGDTLHYCEDLRHDGQLVPTNLTREEVEKIPAAERERRGIVALRERINNPHISGPYDTGWDTTDFDEKLRMVKIGLPNLPGQIVNREIE